MPTENRTLCNPVEVHPDGSATLLGTRWTRTWTESMTYFDRLHQTSEAAIAGAVAKAKQRGAK